MGNQEHWPFSGLQMFGYDLIVADCPWKFETRSDKGEAKSAQAQYPCMPTRDICVMPVDLLAGSDCWLFLWATGPMLKDALRVMEAWRFEYVTLTVWRKVTKNGKPSMGTGYIVRSMAEVILIGKIGNPPRAKALLGLFDGVRREHSRKPEEFYQRVERFAPKARRLDLFTRQSRPGWTAFGDEATKFDEAAQ